MGKREKPLVETTSCGTIPWRFSPRLGVEVCLVKQFSHKDAWSVPKGHVNDGESVEDCAIRETREEAGIVVTLGHRLRDVSIETKKEKKTVKTFLSSPVGDSEPSPNDPDSEVADAKWFQATKLPRIQLYQQPLVKEAIERINALVKDVKRQSFGVEIDQEILSALEIVYSYAAEVDDWLTIKKELVKIITPTKRGLFSRRDEITKRQVPNDLDRAVAAKWSELTGRPCIVIER